jgi:3-dehydroquinate dehydratase-2
MHGANLNKLGKRNPKHYGSLTLQALEKLCKSEAKKYDLTIISFQSNHEGKLIDKLQQVSSKCAGIIINPGAFSHYSYALYDALIDTQLPIIEVHLSNLATREAWRKKSVIKPACINSIMGKKQQGYKLAIKRLANYLQAHHAD